MSMTCMDLSSIHWLAGYYFYWTIRKLLSLAAARVIPWISLKCGTVSSLNRNTVEQNLHIHRQPPVSTFVSAVGSVCLLVSGVSLPPLSAKVPMATSGGERSRSPWSPNTCSTAILSREKTLLQSRHCLALPTFFSRLFFTWTLVMTGLLSLPMASAPGPKSTGKYLLYNVTICPTVHLFKIEYDVICIYFKRLIKRQTPTGVMISRHMGLESISGWALLPAILARDGIFVQMLRVNVLFQVALQSRCVAAHSALEPLRHRHDQAVYFIAVPTTSCKFDKIKIKQVRNQPYNWK